MQLVQTRIRLEAPFTNALTAWRFGFQRRRVTLCACETLLPNCGPLPQISHTCAMVLLQNPDSQWVQRRRVAIKGVTERQCHPYPAESSVYRNRPKRPRLTRASHRSAGIIQCGALRVTRITLKPLYSTR